MQKYKKLTGFVQAVDDSGITIDVPLDGRLYPDGRGYAKADQRDNILYLIMSRLKRKNFSVDRSQNSQGLWRRIYDALTLRDKKPSKQIDLDKTDVKFTEHAIIVSKDSIDQRIPYNPAEL